MDRRSICHELCAGNILTVCFVFWDTLLGLRVGLVPPGTGRDPLEYQSRQGRPEQGTAHSTNYWQCLHCVSVVSGPNRHQGVYRCLCGALRDKLCPHGVCGD
jgi:hypothetical protein